MKAAAYFCLVITQIFSISTASVIKTEFKNITLSEKSAPLPSNTRHNVDYNDENASRPHNLKGIHNPQLKYSNNDHNTKVRDPNYSNLGGQYPSPREIQFGKVHSGYNKNLRPGFDQNSSQEPDYDTTYPPQQRGHPNVYINYYRPFGRFPGQHKSYPNNGHNNYQNPRIQPNQYPRIQPNQYPRIQPNQYPRIQPNQYPRIQPNQYPRIQPNQYPRIQPIQYPRNYPPITDVYNDSEGDYYDEYPDMQPAGFYNTIPNGYMIRYKTPLKNKTEPNKSNIHSQQKVHS